MQFVPRLRRHGFTGSRAAACVAVLLIAHADALALPPPPAQQPPPPPAAPRPQPAATCGLQTGQTFRGTYVCAQGSTELVLRVVDVHGARAEAEFDFDWRGGVHGRYVLSGTCDPATRAWVMHPRAWLDAPRDWVMVGMNGTLSQDGLRYHGQIANEDCAGFDVSR